MIDKSGFSLELHDSSLDSVVQAGEVCLIALRPAYVYEVNVESGELGPCMIVDALLEFEHVTVNGDLGDLPDAILDGSLLVGSDLLKNLIPAPFESIATVTMRLFMRPDYREIVISAQRLTVRLDGVPRLERSPARTVEVFGWEHGFQKVEFTKLLKSDLGYSLSDAKSATDAVLNNEHIALMVGETDVDELLSKLNELGAKFALKDQ
jgi:ribosomal protein L7/L12